MYRHIFSERINYTPVRHRPTLVEVVAPIVQKMKEYGITEVTADIPIDSDLVTEHIELTIKIFARDNYRVFYRSGDMLVRIPLERVFSVVLLIVQREWPRFEQAFYNDICRQCPAV